MPSKTKRNTNTTGRKLKYDEMVTLSILALKDRNGSSSYAISKYMKENFPITSDTVLKVQLRNAIRRMEEDGRIIRNKASFKLTPEAKAQFLKKSGKSTSTKKKESTSSTKKVEPKKKTPAKETKAKKSATTDKSKTKAKATSVTKKSTSAKKSTGSKSGVSKKTSGKRTQSTKKETSK